jgi:hypothetical protein
MQAVAPAWLDPLREQLLPDLQAAGLDIDTRSRLNIEAWLDAAQARALLTDDPRCAQGALRAIVSKSARDQQLFDQVFESWRQRWDHAAELLGSPEAAKASPAAASPSHGPAAARSIPLAYSLLLAVVLAVAVIVAIDYARKNWPGTPAKPAVERPDKPLAEGPAPVVPQLDLAATLVVGQTEVQAPPWLFGLHPAAYAAAVLLLGSAGWFVRRTRKDQLARISTRENLREQEVFARQLLPVSGKRRTALRAAARTMRKLRPTELHILDIVASTRATASRAGAFAAVHRTRMAMPEYLFLVDRACSGDQQAHWAAEMARDLAAEGVALALYEFDRDPRWVAPLQVHRSAGAGAVQRYQPLSLLAARHAGQGLIVLADGHGFIDPASGTLHAWLQGALAPWPRRVLMTPRPLANWGAAEQIIAGAGQPAHADAFLLLPARIESLTAAPHWFDAGEVPDVSLLPGAPALLPPVLEDDSGRWVGREAPSDAELVALIEQLRGFLGPAAYTWLAASAAYPHLSADLTAYLAHQLSEAPQSAAGNPAAPADARLLEARLVGIAQLPWCRFGMMPDWLRRALFLSLAPATREQVRLVLARLFGAAGRGDAALGVSLGVVATDDPEQARKGPLRMLRRLGRRIGLSGVVENEPSDSPLRDVIYLGVLRGDFDPTLSLDATEEFARAVRAETGTRLTRNPLRWIAALVVTALYPLVWLKWWAGGPLLRYARAVANIFVQSWKESYSNAESFYAAIGKSFVRLGTRLSGAKPVAPVSASSDVLVYLSYTRSESGAAAIGLRKRLDAIMGFANVWDNAELRAGTSLEEEVRRALDRCSIVVALIGRNAFHSARTWQVDEIAYALAAGKPVVPVLLDGAAMPDTTDLPESIIGLSRYQTFELHADRMEADLDRLADRIARSIVQHTVGA